MSSFEGYHPLLTPSFRFDWLNRFKLKNVATLTNRDLAETADWINNTMRSTMKESTLTWGIERRRTHKLVGWGGFFTLDLPAHTGHAGLEGKRLPINEQQEIVDRLVNFGRDELQLTEMTLTPSVNLDETVLAAAGFTANTVDADWTWRLHR